MCSPFDASSAWELDGQVSLRPERFGALAYNFGTRRLSFLKSPVLLRLLQLLANYPSALEACSALGIEEEQEQMLRALETLAGTGIIVRREQK